MEAEQVRIAAKELQLEKSAEAPVIFHGHSMWPFFRDGDALVIRPATFAEVRVGDIVTFRKQEKFPTYRLISKAGGKLTLQGDNWPDAVVEALPEDVLGVVVARDRDGRRLASDSLTWRLLALLRTSRLARRRRHAITRIVRWLFGFDPGVRRT